MKKKPKKKRETILSILQSKISDFGTLAGKLIAKNGLLEDRVNTLESNLKNHAHDIPDMAIGNLQTRLFTVEEYLQDRPAAKRRKKK